MNKTVETQIINAEERLRLAMLASDVSALNQLLGSVFKVLDPPNSP